MPAVFVRLAGCNLRCAFCDSKYSYQGKRWSEKKLIEEILKYPCKRVIWTGGEPTLQIEKIYKIIKELPIEYQHEIESNGTRKFMEHTFNVVTISPKKGKLKQEVIKSFRNGVAWKFVIENEDDINYWMDFIEIFGIKKEDVWLMPEGITRESIIEKSIWLVERCKELGIKFSPRLHILIWNNQRAR